MSASRTWAKTSLHNTGVRRIKCKRSCKYVNNLFETHLREVLSGFLEGPAFQNVSAQSWHFNSNLAVLKYHSKPFLRPSCPLQAPGRQLDFWEAKMDADRFLRGSFADERRNQGTQLIPTFLFCLPILSQRVMGWFDWWYVEFLEGGGFP